MSKKNDLRLQREGTVINSISKKQARKNGMESIQPLRSIKRQKMFLSFIKRTLSRKKKKERFLNKDMFGNKILNFGAVRAIVT